MARSTRRSGRSLDPQKAAAMDKTDTPIRQAIEDFLLVQRVKQHSPNTIHYYSDAFQDFSGWLDEQGFSLRTGDVTTELLRAYQLNLQTESTIYGRLRTPGGVVHKMRAVRTLVNFLLEESYLTAPPRLTIPPLKRATYVVFDDTELDRIFRSRYLTGSSEQAVRNRAIVGLLLDSALRISELCNLRVDDILFESGTTGLVRVLHGKGDKDRYVPFSASSAKLLKEWIAVRGTGDDTLFELSPEGLRTLFRRMETETGLDIKAHKFRHTSATMMVRAKMPLESVKRVLGHSKLATTEIYLSLSHDDIREHHAEASPLALFEQRTTTRSVRRRRLEPRRKLRVIDGLKQTG